MSRMGLIGLMGLMGLMGLGLMGCSSSSDDVVATPAPQPAAAVRLMSYVTGYEEPDRANMVSRRAWEVPSGYSRYEDDKSISVFFTQDGVPAEADKSPMEEFFFYTSGSWRVSKKDLEAETYYLYGYMPYDKSFNASISSTTTPNDNSAYSDGAVLTLENLPTITPYDFCVMIGAKDGTSADDDNGLARGSFAYAAQPTEGDDKGDNYVYLLFDHLYAALRVRMKGHGEYNALRTIKLKELKLKTSVDETPTKKKTNVAITLEKKADGGNPVKSVVFTTPVGETAEAVGTMFENTGGMTLTTSYSEYINHFMPKDVTTFILESTYDVYDKNVSEGHPEGNLVRQNCKATNTIKLSDLISGQTETRRGARYTINLTIQPTYLYVLSEPDLDDPTVVVE